MCFYRKKEYTCTHLSGPYLELCRPARLINHICDDAVVDDKHCKSYFPCYDCIRTEARAEAQEAAAKARELHEQVSRERQLAEQRAKGDRIRREACDKAAREREQEAAARLLREQEQERARKDGGLWVETGSGRKGRNRRTGPGLGPPVSNPAPLPMRNIFTRGMKENDGGLQPSPKRDGAPLGSSGRAGLWGPKKILSRSENTARNEDGMAKK